MYSRSILVSLQLEWPGSLEEIGSTGDLGTGPWSLEGFLRVRI